MSGKPTVISTFCGTGGSSLGYKWAGFKELLAIDYDSHAVECFKLNFPEVPVWYKSVTDITGQQILDFCKIKKGELDIFDGSPPCQGFSTAGKRQVNDKRNNLFKHYCRLVTELEPKVFVMENVTGMVKGKFKGKFIEIMKTLKAMNYNVKCKQMNSKYYGVPQSRERLIFIGVRKDLGIEPSYPIAGKKIILAGEADLKDRVKARYSDKRYGDIIVNREKPAPTLTRLGRLFFNKDEMYGIKSLCSFCSFPDDWQLGDSYTKAKDRLGNAVMPKFMEAIARNIKDNILNKYCSRVK